MCYVSDGEGDAPSVSIMGSFLRGLFWIVMNMQDISISFTVRISEMTFAQLRVSCLAKERCIPSVANFEINTSQVS